MDRPQRPITAEEYARLPDPDNGTLDDLIDGVIVYRPIPSALHGIVCGNAGFALGEYRKQHGGMATPRCGMIVSRDPDTVVGPDAAYWRLRESVVVEQGWPTIPPQAAFEVVDTEEPYPAVMRRIRLLLRFGTGVLWLVDSLGEEVLEFRGQAVRRFTPSDTLDGGDVLPGFTCKVADLFG